ncbi:MAG: membrane dipeptidase [Prevotella sp.]|nr:membrane dipeptidase [Prevotella sp.]
MKYDLQSHLDGIYMKYPEIIYRPVIGVTTNYSGGDACIRDQYYRQIVDAGGIPILIPPIADKDVILNTLERIDGLLLTGGADYNPLWCGEEPSQNLHEINATRDLPELLITQLAFNRQIPMLGVCRGIQTLAIALGGEVEQDVYEHGAIIKHSQDADRSERTHSVSIEKESILYSLYAVDKMFVNSFHHQAVRAAGRHFKVTARSADNVIEAMESCEEKSIMGVQWHPEWLGKDGLPLFYWLVERASEFNKAKKLHNRILTVDTHVDTPMFFSQGIHFEQRDNRILVDLHKMTEGRQDAVFMVAYLPQPAVGENFQEKISFNVSGPKAYADLIIDKIEEIVNSNHQYISIAKTPAELVANKREDRKSIVLGIENGLAIENNLANIAHFKKRGIAYITLCHNGDNGICDSARGSQTHGGVSLFGEKVIREMNRLGIIVDLSHGAEKSFYDALDISQTPIVCSHSNCKALCDVPRNLTDDQLRALAAKGGVVHTTLYSGFLRESGKATILDAIAHLEHAISVMGVEHVGIGTDFDGDGGVFGFADSSEAINFTMQLLRRRYSEADIERIWGGNWLRVMQQVQSYYN